MASRNMCSETFALASQPLLCIGDSGPSRTDAVRFRSMFGVSTTVCALTWNLIGREKPRGSRPIHLLWALLFLNGYASETQNSSLAGVDEKTFRKWAWSFVGLIANIGMLRFIVCLLYTSPSPRDS